MTHQNYAQVPVSKEGHAHRFREHRIWGTQLNTAPPQLPVTTVVHTGRGGPGPSTNRDPERGSSLAASGQGCRLNRTAFWWLLPCAPPASPASPGPQEEAHLLRGRPRNQPSQTPTRPPLKGSSCPERDLLPRPAQPLEGHLPLPPGGGRGAGERSLAEAPPDPCSKARRSTGNLRPSARVDTWCCTGGSTRQALGPLCTGLSLAELAGDTKHSAPGPRQVALDTSSDPWVSPNSRVVWETPPSAWLWPAGRNTSGVSPRGCWLHPHARWAPSLLSSRCGRSHQRLVQSSSLRVLPLLPPLPSKEPLTLWSLHGHPPAGRPGTAPPPARLAQAATVSPQPPSPPSKKPDPGASG